MATINYKASFIMKLHTALEQNPTLTLGEILYSFLHKENIKGKHFWHASDEEIYTALESFNKFGTEQDEPLDTNEFNFWIDQVTILRK